MIKRVDQQDANVSCGDFFTDGKTVAFQLKDLPISGAGATAQDVFVNLMDRRRGHHRRHIR